jgi:cytochrome c553
MKRPINIIAGVSMAVMALTACKTDPNSPGVEYMPDMYRSPALEAYVDYGNTKVMDLTQIKKDGLGVVPVLSRRPPVGTIPFQADPNMAQFMFPYPLKNTPEDYERAATEIHSPLQSNKANIERGANIYSHMCTHCHGKEGHGDGAIAKNGKILGIPDYSTKLKDLPEGKIFHTLTYGKGLMGQHASQLTKLDRWQVVEWVKCLQKGITTPEYDANGMLVVKAAESAPADSTMTK